MITQREYGKATSAAPPQVGVPPGLRRATTAVVMSCPHGQRGW
ncbi:hypothetical protein ACFFOP_24655 [Sinosporangium siamense]